MHSLNKNTHRVCQKTLVYISQFEKGRDLHSLPNVGNILTSDGLDGQLKKIGGVKGEGCRKPPITSAKTIKKLKTKDKCMSEKQQKGKNYRV